jgi:hypothetical protein
MEHIRNGKQKKRWVCYSLSVNIIKTSNPRIQIPTMPTMKAKTDGSIGDKKLTKATMHITVTATSAPE